MAAKTPPGNGSVYISGLARQLINKNLLSEESAIASQREAQRSKQPLVRYLADNDKVDSTKLAVIASNEFGVPRLDLSAFDIDPDVLEIVDYKLVEKHHVIPLFARGKTLFIGVVDPTQSDVFSEIRFQSGMTVEPVVVEAKKLDRAVEDALSAMGAGSMDLDDENLDDLATEDPEKDKATDITRADVDDAPIVRFVNKMMLDAIKRGASDIHFEPYEKRYRIRFRIDGVLKEVASPPISQAMRVAARVKVMSQMDLAERRIPQDGRIKIILSKNRDIDFRVSSCPTLFGEKIVLRILDPGSAKLGIEALGYEPFQKDMFLKTLNKPYGMILVTGPTGSGKTVSLYTGVNILNTPERNISTAEDPAEINLEGVNQVNVNPKVGLTFSSALRSFLRQDPDVILVGEIRDLDTAEIAIKAAQTGHLVLSTLHTNDSAQTLTRLLNMGVPAFNIATSVTLIIAQRLARKLCVECRKPIEIPREELIAEGFEPDHIDANDFQLYEACGCENCTDGFKGRTGIYEVMEVSEEIGNIIMNHGNSMQIAEQAQKEGVWTLRRSALHKVAQGITSLTEANRVTLD